MNYKRIKSKNTYPSITDWFNLINSKKFNNISSEDNNKYRRLELLNKITNLPYTPAIRLSINDLNIKTEKLNDALKEFKGKECVLRLLPKNSKRVKIRKKGGLLENNLKWFYKNKFSDSYDVEIVPRCGDIKWSSIFIVDDNMIWGEIIKGGISQLVNGKHKIKPLIFSYDYKRWHFSNTHHEKEKLILQKAINKIKISKSSDLKKIKELLNSSFTHKKYIKGYFEFTVWPKDGIKFIDYSRHQAKFFTGFDVWQSVMSNGQKFKGICANEGKVNARVRVVNNPKNNKDFRKGDILVCKMIDINYLPLIKKASAILTENGNILCHAAIISRELNKPCIIQVKNITKKLIDGDRISINAKYGEITKILK